MWIILAVGASIFWGLTYAIDEQIFKHISVQTSLGISCFIASVTMLIVSYLNNNLKLDLLTITSSNKTQFLILGGTFTFIVAELLIGLAITQRSATLAGLIEISYPIFVALFSFILFKTGRISLSIIIGGLLIYTGVSVIYLFNK